MANNVLTSSIILREGLRLAHQKANFIGTINRQYDDSFAQTGAKVGDTIRVRKPNQYTVTTGATLVKQDTTEEAVSLKVDKRKHVGLSFTDQDLTLSLDDFSKRIIEPAVTALIASVEADAQSMYKKVSNSIWNGGAAATYNGVLDGRVELQRNLAPNGSRTANMNPLDMANIVKDTKTLFNDQSSIGKQYRDGYVGKNSGFEFVENTIWAAHTRGGSNGAYLVNGASQVGSTLVVDTGATAPAEGDIITIAGVFDVHPETKASTGVLKKFVIGAGATTTSFPISPAIVATGARKNVSGSPADNAAITFLGTASTAVGTSMLYHEDAFTFATADLVMPKGVDFAARETLDGISMLLVRDYDINDATFPCRLDILYGYEAFRPEWAVRLHNS